LHRVYDNMLQRAQKCTDVLYKEVIFSTFSNQYVFCICICLISCTESETYAHIGL